MFLSIIIPVYNAEQYLSECLESCYAQDLSFEEYEIICVDDGSTDQSEAIIRDYSYKYENLHYYYQKNSGVSNARNAGMKKAKGDYLWFVDADDFINDNVLSVLREKAYSTNCDCLSFRLCFFDDVVNARDKQLEHRIQGKSILGGAQSACLLRKNCIDFYWSSGIEVGEDAIFMSQFKMVADKYAEMDEICYYYRQQPNSTLHKNTDYYKRLHSHVDGAIIMR